MYSGRQTMIKYSKHAYCARESKELHQPVICDRCIRNTSTRLQLQVQGLQDTSDHEFHDVSLPSPPLSLPRSIGVFARFGSCRRATDSYRKGMPGPFGIKQYVLTYLE